MQQSKLNNRFQAAEERISKFKGKSVSKFAQSAKGEEKKKEKKWTEPQRNVTKVHKYIILFIWSINTGQLYMNKSRFMWFGVPHGRNLGVTSLFYQKVKSWTDWKIESSSWRGHRKIHSFQVWKNRWTERISAYRSKNSKWFLPREPVLG